MPKITILNKRKTTNNEPTLIHFHDENSPHSRIQSVVMNKFDDIQVKVRDVHEHKDSFDMYEIDSIPTLIFIADNNEVKRWNHVVSHEEILNTVNQYL
jgi:hypothetical protein